MRVRMGWVAPRFSRRVMYWLNQTKGASAMTSSRSEWAVNVTKYCQYSAPIVFGTISEKTSIAIVIVAGTATRVIQGFACAQITAACSPTPIAPTVCAMVLSVRIAARGRSMLALKSSR